jgi:hypothetical protein
MKKSILLSVLVLAAITPALAQNSTSNSAVAILDPYSDVSVAKGMSREAVTLMLGVPSESIATNVWIYWDFRGKGVPNAAHYDTLLLVFTDGKVSTIRLCENKPLRDYVAKMKAKAGTKTVAAK